MTIDLVDIAIARNLRLAFLLEYLRHGGTYCIRPNPIDDGVVDASDEVALREVWGEDPSLVYLGDNEANREALDAIGVQLRMLPAELDNDVIDGLRAEAAAAGDLITVATCKVARSPAVELDAQDREALGGRDLPASTARDEVLWQINATRQLAADAIFGQ